MTSFDNTSDFFRELYIDSNVNVETRFSLVWWLSP